MESRRPSSGRRRSRPASLAPANRSFRIGRSVVAALFALVLLGAATAERALAQGGGMVGVADRFSSAERFDQHDTNLQGITLSQLKRSYKAGIKDLKDGKCRAAAIKFDAVLDHIEDDAQLYYVAATAYRCAQSFRVAAELYETVIELDEDFHSAYRFLGVSRLALGDFEEAAIYLGELETKRVQCTPECDPSLVEASAALRDALEFVQAIANDEDGKAEVDAPPSVAADQDAG